MRGYRTVNGSIRAQVALRTFVLAALLGLLLVGLQFLGPSLGLTRQVGLWLWAAVGLALTLLLYLPLLRRAGVSQGRVAVFAAALLIAGAGTYLYVAWVMVPNAVARVGHR